MKIWAPQLCCFLVLSASKIIHPDVRTSLRMWIKVDEVKSALPTRVEDKGKHTHIAFKVGSNNRQVLSNSRKFEVQRTESYCLRFIKSPFDSPSAAGVPSCIKPSCTTPVQGSSLYLTVCIERAYAHSCRIAKCLVDAPPI